MLRKPNMNIKRKKETQNLEEGDDNNKESLNDSPFFF